MAEELPVPVEKIKKEKVTPPSSPVRGPEAKLDEIIPNLFRPEHDQENSREGQQGDGEPDEKKDTGPVKTSDEFLMELFQVFNAAMPTKKKKHKKHKKKSKKRKRDSKSDLSDISDSEKEEGEVGTESKRRKVKVKKEKDLDSDDLRRTLRKVKKEKRSKSRERSPSGKRHPDKDVKKEKDSRHEKDTRHDKEKDTRHEKEKESRHEKGKEGEKRQKMSSKIVIKDLKNSLAMVQTESQNISSRTERRRTSLRKGSRSSSSLSLSDEETYEREKQMRQRRTRELPRREEDNFRSSYRESRRSRRTSPRTEEDMRDRIDKKKLLEIARKNAMTMLKNGALPGITTMKELQRSRFGGKSIDELTDFCKKLSNGEVLTDLSSVSSGDSDHDKEGNSKAFHHPFVLRDRGPIVMNIRNSVPLPTRSVDQTNAILQAFPVSSGQQHRQSEMEWVPVEPTKALKAIEAKPAKKPTGEPVPSASKAPLAIMPPPPPNVDPGPQMAHPPAFVSYPPLKSYASSCPVEPLQPPPQPPSMLTDTVFPKPPEVGNFDVSSIISQRLNAMRKLQENPNDNAAMALMENSQKEMSSWAASKFTPGKFLGSTGANILSAKELQRGGTQAWAKRDAFINSAPLSGGKGMHLLQKMGWKPGEALGKEKTGSLEPLLLEVKLDRKGLIADEEGPNQKKRRPPGGGGGGPRNMQMTQQFMESKHPVSLLGELASKRKWGPPMYECVHESGPHHHKSFVYQVIMNGMAYTPAIPSTTKKEAKKMAAQVCLEQLGVLPTQQGPIN